MSVLRKLVLGETRTLPLGVALVLAAALLFRAVLADQWKDVGGFVVLAGVLLVLVVSVSVSAGRGRAR